MLVSAKEMLTKAKEGKYAVGQFNINNLEWTKAILQTAKEHNSPVILGVSEGAGKYMGGWDAVVGMVNGLLKDMKITVPVALHIDHGTYAVSYTHLDVYKRQVMFQGHLCEDDLPRCRAGVGLRRGNDRAAARDFLRIPGGGCDHD